ncbi:MAG: Asp-tRNA(Asn)/Glu-tRNA(Gln) amidotransferase subunit GatB [Candidatus Nomurabacteria bacterium]|nr:MAG: Asp-tRNA(Asn)/Glu-tRNA(Gln) amidotransferase subunit GatB [Candidatus Nomurabacteria bacterium]
MATYETIIGLEIHVQLKTKSKLFCACDNTGEGQAPNTTICEICTAQPGTLPVPNQQAIDWSVLAALGLNCKINTESKFDRKHYFYPDLSKGYQISQLDQPIGENGYLDVVEGEQAHRVRIERLHLEEDSAKLLHEPGQEMTQIDFNRAGTPLAEIVTKPDIQTPAQARIFLTELRLLMRYLGVSNADMEKGQLRVDANISLRPEGDTELYPKTEIKNLNSFRSVERALTFEVERQTKLWEAGMPPMQLATRGWEETKNETVEQRTKEEAADYRYFPEPDIPPLHFSAEYLEKIAAAMPELPAARRQRYQSELGFPVEVIERLVTDQHLGKFAEEVVSELRAWMEAENEPGLVWEQEKGKYAKQVANLLVHRYEKLRNEVSNAKDITPENFAEYVKIVQSGAVNAPAAQQLLEEMVKIGGDPSDIVAQKGLGQVSDEGALRDVVQKVLDAHPEKAEEYRKGKIALLKFFLGQAMRETQGRADPKVLEKLLEERLTSA